MASSHDVDESRATVFNEDADGSTLDGLLVIKVAESNHLRQVLDLEVGQSGGM
jgi:hypothetical protein